MAMNQITEELDAKLRTLDDVRAERLARMVRDAITADQVARKGRSEFGCRERLARWLLFRDGRDVCR